MNEMNAEIETEEPCNDAKQDEKRVVDDTE